ICYSTPSPYSFSHHPPTPDTYTPSLHDALPIYQAERRRPDPSHDPRAEVGEARSQVDPAEPQLLEPAQQRALDHPARDALRLVRSEEHTSELQSRVDLVCRLLLEKKK